MCCVLKVQKEPTHNEDRKGKSSMSKRKILSRIARLYDPIGYTAAVLIRAKIGMQKLWQLGYDWDQPIKPQLAQEWEAFFADLEKLNQLELPRCLTPHGRGWSTNTLHIFGCLEGSIQSLRVPEVAVKQRRL